MVAVRPFRFTGLPRYTNEQVALQESMARHLSYRPFTPGFRKSLGQTLGSYLKVECRISKGELRPVGRADLDALLPGIGCLLVIGAAPGEHKILVDLDTNLAAFCIERLLGGTGEAERIRRPLTDIEQGVLSFLILRGLELFHDGLRTGHELALSLDRFAATLDEVREIVDVESGYEVLGYRVGLEKRVGYLRLLIPNGLVTRSFTTPPDQGRPTEQELRYIVGVLSSVGDTPVVIRLEAARLDLAPSDLAGLEPGDIIVLESHQLQKTPEGIEGEVFARVGLGNNGGLRGRLLNDGDVVRLQILDIVVQEQPAEAPMSNNDELDEGSGEGLSRKGSREDRPEDREVSTAENGLGEAEGMLRDIPAPVVVELGRLRMNMSQVVRLRKGQILRLPRGPNDPVDLVVSGKLFARGELVEVDGDLGVRLVQIAGAD